MAPCLLVVLADSMMVPVVVSIPYYLNIHHGWAHVSPPGWSHLATAKCHAPTCCWESTPGWPSAFLLGWHSASCWLLGCSTSVTSSFTMDKQLFVSMVGPMYCLSLYCQMPCTLLWLGSTLAWPPHPLTVCLLLVVVVVSQPWYINTHHGGAHVSPHGIHSLLPQHSPWMGTCFSLLLVPPHHCQVPCTHLLLGIHSWMANCMPTRLAVSILLVARVLHFCYLIIHHGQPYHSLWTSNCLSPWLAPSLYCQMPCTLLWLWVHSYMATLSPHSVPPVGCCCGVPTLVH
jgi:hypothetical protein